MNPVVEFLDVLLEMSAVLSEKLNVVFEVSGVVLQQLDNSLLLFNSFCCDGGLPR